MISRKKMRVVLTAMLAIAAMITVCAAAISLGYHPGYVAVPLLISVFFITMYLVHHLLGPVPQMVFVFSGVLWACGLGTCAVLKLLNLSDAAVTIVGSMSSFVFCMFSLPYMRRVGGARAKAESVAFLNNLPWLRHAEDAPVPTEVAPEARRAVGVFLMICSGVGSYVLGYQLKDFGVGDFWCYMAAGMLTTYIFSGLIAWVRQEPAKVSGAL